MMPLFSEDIDDANLETPSLGPNAEWLDHTSFHDYCRLLVPASSPASVDILARRLSRAFLGVEPDAVTALFILHCIKSSRGLENMVSDGEHGAQYFRCRQGT